MKSVQTAPPFPGHREKEIERNKFPVARGEDVIGRLAIIRLETGDTLPDIARHFSLGINAISTANPGVDVWVPEAGKRVLLPLSFILPDAPRKGIVINLAAMRLFQYKGDSEPLTVLTYPVGVGTDSDRVGCHQQGRPILFILKEPHGGQVDHNPFSGSVRQDKTQR